MRVKTYRYILIAFFTVIASHAFSQLEKNDIGLRIGFVNGMIGEANFQHNYSYNHRIEGFAGIHYDQSWTKWYLGAAKEWTWPMRKGFYWYAGGGLEFGFWDYSKGFHDFEDDGFYIGLVGILGVEYMFRRPYKISADMRPRFPLYKQAGEDFLLNFTLGFYYEF